MYKLQRLGDETLQLKICDYHNSLFLQMQINGKGN